MRHLVPRCTVKTIADGIKNAGSVGAQSAAATALFGRAGLDLLPMLRQGGTALDEFVAKQDKMGTALGGDDMDAIKRAKDAIPKITGMFDGLWNKTVVAMAPAIEAGGNFVGMLTDKMTPAIQWVGKATQHFWDIAGPAFEAVLGYVSGSIDAFLNWGSGIAGLSGVQLPTLKEAAVGAFKAIATVGGYAWDTLKLGAGLAVGGIGMVVQGVGILLEKLRDLADLLPDDARPAWMDKIVDGAADIGRAARKAGEDMKAWGDGTLGSWGSSAELFRNKIDEIANTPKKVELSMEFVGPLLPPAEVEKAAELVKSKFAANTAITAGAQAEQSTILRFQNDSVSVSKDQLKEQKAQTKHLEKISKDAAKIAGKTGMDFVEFDS